MRFSEQNMNEFVRSTNKKKKSILTFCFCNQHIFNIGNENKLGNKATDGRICTKKYFDKKYKTMIMLSMVWPVWELILCNLFQSRNNKKAFVIIWNNQIMSIFENMVKFFVMDYLIWKIIIQISIIVTYVLVAHLKFLKNFEVIIPKSIKLKNGMGAKTSPQLFVFRVIF